MMKFIIILVIIMFLTLIKMFGLPSANATQYAELKARSIDLSGNILQFSMPENFSKDMPASNMIDSVNINDASLFTDPIKFTLIRRFWDIERANSWFGKNAGSLMMAIYIKKAPNTLNLLDRFQFVKAIEFDFHQTYDLKNRELLSKGDELLVTGLPASNMDYLDHVADNKIWTRYFLGNTREFSHVYALPVNQGVYVEVVFTYMPVDGLGMRDFIGEDAGPLADKISTSLSIKYVLNSETLNAVSDMSKLGISAILAKEANKLEDARNAVVK